MRGNFYSCDVTPALDMATWRWRHHSSSSCAGPFFWRTFPGVFGCSVDIAVLLVYQCARILPIDRPAVRELIHKTTWPIALLSNWSVSQCDVITLTDITCKIYKIESRDSSVGIVTGSSGLFIQVDESMFLLSNMSVLFLGPIQHRFQYVMGVLS